MKLNTVNVIVLEGDLVGFNVTKMASFEDTPDGNTEAEKMFRNIVAENGDNDTPEDIDGYVENGAFEFGDFHCFLVHSTDNK